MGKKKFIDKKKAATFRLFARDSSDPLYSKDPENDHVFLRVDNNPVSISMDDDHDDDFDNVSHSNDPHSIYAGTPDDVDYEKFGGQAHLPDQVRKEVLELGFPDDGYNYLTHLREIRNTGGGSAFYDNPKANLHDLTHDVKAYDASRVQIRQAEEDTSSKTLYNVAEKTVNVKVHQAADAEIALFLEGSESEFGSDIEDLEEDFVVQANLLEDSEIGDMYDDKSLTLVSKPQDEELQVSDSIVFPGVLSQVPSTSTVEMDPSFTREP